MKDKEKEFNERVNCGIAYCDDAAVEEIKQDFKMQEEMFKDLVEIFDEEYHERALLTPTFTARKLKEKGYCKLPENSVVISKDNYNRLKRDSELYEARHEEKLKLFAKAYNDDKERITALRIKHLEEEVMQTRKQTAMEIYQKLQSHDTTYVKKWIKERYGVEAWGREE